MTAVPQRWNWKPPPPAHCTTGEITPVRYLKPVASTAAAALTPAGEALWEPGQVTICCTTDDDVHVVAAVGKEPTVGIHVYGGNIGTIRRRSYDPTAGEARWFVSGWDQAPRAVPQAQTRASKTAALFVPSSVRVRVA